MKALSIKQPYAYLICKGIKDIENRTWRTNFRGRVYIHASAKSANEPYMIFTDEQIDVIDNIIMDICESYELTSAIIGHVDIVDCVESHSSIWAEHWVTKEWHNGVFGGTYDKVVYNWVLANPVLYDKPILNVKGKLSFWDCSNYLKIRI